MPVVVTKSEMRHKPVTMLKNARAWFITLADRAANWTPWVKKDDSSEGRGALSCADLETAGALNPWQNGKVVGSHRDITPTELKKLAEQQLLRSIGANKMAGEVIQAIIAPMSADPEQLKAIIGEDEYRKFKAEKAEQFEDCIKYVQADESMFTELDGAALGDSGFKAVFGRLNSAEKADESTLIPFQSKWGMSESRPIPSGAAPFREAVGEKVHTLKDQICTLVSLDRPVSETREMIMEQVAAFQDWLEEALDSVEQATKSDPPVKPKFTDRLKSMLFGGSDKPHIRDRARKGDGTMTPEEIKELTETVASEAAKATVNEMVTKAEQEEAAKADVEAQTAEKAERDELKTKINGIIDYIAAQKAEKEAQGATATPEAQAAAEKAEREQAEAEMKDLKEKLAKLTEKMDAMNRTPGGRTETEVTTGFTKPIPGQAIKYDPANPYDCFNTMGMPAGRA